MIKKLMHFIKEEDGAGLAEYALLLVLIAVVCIGVITSLGTSIQGAFQEIIDAL
jgi:pilus assembly protein Flp/PilA